MVTKVAKDRSGEAIQVLEPTGTQRMTMTGAVHANVTIRAGINVVRVVANTDVHVAIGSIAFQTDMPLPKNVPEYFEISGDVSRVISANSDFTATAGAVWVTDME